MNRKSLLLVCVLVAGGGPVCAEKTWFPVEDVAPVALLPPLSAMPQTVGALVATRTPEAYVTLSVPNAAPDASNVVFYSLTPARPIPDASLVQADIVNTGDASVSLGLAFRLKAGGEFRWNVSLPPGRRHFTLSPTDCVSAVPTNRWADVTGLVLSVAARTSDARSSLTIRNLSAVEAFQMRSRGGCPWPEERELLPADRTPLVFTSCAGEFKGKPDARSFSIPVDGRAHFGDLPFLRSGGKLVLTIRATDPQTRAVEIGFHQSDGAVWGSTALAISTEWQEVVLPFRRMQYFRHWGLPALPPDAKPDATKFTSVHFCFGKWLCGDTLDQPHGFEVKSIKITQ